MLEFERGSLPEPFGNLLAAPARRQALLGIALSVGGLLLARAANAEDVSRAAESIHQEPVFKASRKRVYAALTDAKQFDRVSRLSAAVKSGMALGTAPTMIRREAGGAFSLFGGHIVGRQIELVPNERIVQAWRATNWDAGIFSIARFELHEHDGGTRIVFDHTGFPKGEGEHLAQGWIGNYWEPLARFLA